jgi:replicative DNA helicase
MARTATSTHRDPEPPTDPGERLVARLPPQNLDAERSVLGCMLFAVDAIDLAIGALKPDDFYHDAHQRIFSAIIELHEKGKVVDAVTLAERLAKKKILDEVGGVSYIHEILETVPHAAHLTYYADIVRDKANYRRLIDASTESIRDCYDESRTPVEIAASIEDRTHRVVEHFAGDTREMSLHAAVHRALASITEETRRWGLFTAFDSLDRILRGLRPGNLVILAGRTSTGKTAFVCNIARNVAARGDGVYYASLEQGVLEIAERFISHESRISMNGLRNNTLPEGDAQRILDAAGRMDDWPLMLDVQRGLTVTQIAARIRTRMRREPIKLVIVDYLQLVEPDDRKVPREQQVANISRRLFTLAGQLSLPIIALAQLHRGVETREDKRPRLSDLRESGAIEQDADVVLLLDRRDINNQNPDGEGCNPTLIVAKNRNGATGDVKLTFHGPTFTFTDAGRHDVPLDNWDDSRLPYEKPLFE